ncbi:sugar-transfer associated ATP-grasp domain-containing protein [Oceanobacillus luteolus]|uniref:Sugar-transfer associated ATP-grasp domain-containing protein n=1 Tax=Oceanobacillus luteolus TaxID=1274358 RepID=A0ABW4HQ98_9BACI
MEYTSKILASTNNYKITVHTNNKQNNKYIITFGEVDSKLTETGFSSKLIMKEGYNHIYVAQKFGTQYQFLKREDFYNIIREEIKGKKVYTYGASLGGYCAIYYGSIINANILAMSPRIPAHPIINKMMGKVFRNKGFLHDELSKIQKNYEKLHVFYDKTNYIDNYYVNIFIRPAFPTAVLHHIKHAGHYTARALLLSGELKKIALNFFEDKELTFTLDEEKILAWHVERLRKRLDQGKLFHARENLDVLMQSNKANLEEVKELVNEYREKLLMGKDIKKMVKTVSNKNIYEKHNINTGKKAFTRFYNAGLLDPVNEDFLNDVDSYWNENYGQSVDPVLNLAYFNLTKNNDPRVIPSKIMWNQLIPYFNDMNIRIGYSDKNIYDQIIGTPNAPKTILKRVRGHYFNHKNEELSTEEALQTMLDYKDDLIIKPSDTDNGKGIKKISYKDNEIYLDGSNVEMQKLEEDYGYNFTVQEVIKQHEIMAKPHPASVNTLRMVTLRWKNEIHYLLTFARFGADNSVKDNAGTGGLCIGVNDNGEFLDFAIDESCNIYTKHPTTNYNFEDHAKIPEFEKYKNFVKDLHKKILHHDFVSWDIAVGVNNEPIFIEANYRGATWLYQLAAQRPLFGDLTDEILQHVANERKQNINKDIQSNLTTKTKKLKDEIKELKQENKKLQSKVKKNTKKTDKSLSELNKLKKENQKLKQELKYMKNSKSWKSTALLRKLVKK